MYVMCNVVTFTDLMTRPNLLHCQKLPSTTTNIYPPNSLSLSLFLSLSLSVSLSLSSISSDAGSFFQFLETYEKQSINGKTDLYQLQEEDSELQNKLIEVSTI